MPFHPDRQELSAGTEEDPEAREEWFWRQRAYPKDTIPVDVHRRELLRELENRQLRAAADETWTSLGPSPLLGMNYRDSRQDSSGRALTVAIHPADPNTLLLGTAQGGIWKSTDRGATWRSVGEQVLPTLAVNVIRYNPSNPSLVYAGTGEPNGSGSMFGFGVLRSTDGGETWELLPSRGNGWNFDHTSITGLQFNARDAGTIYLTTATVLTRTNTFFAAPEDLPTTGFFKSTDGGQSWQLLRAAKRHQVANSRNAGFLDLEYGGAAAPNLLFVSEYYGGILRSTDSGNTWRYVTALKPNGYGAFPADVPRVSYPNGGIRWILVNRIPGPTTEIDFRRPEIALSPSNPQIVYAGYDAPGLRLDLDGNGTFDSGTDRQITTSLLFKSVDGGETWRWLGSQHDGVPDYCGQQCFYDNAISVDPANPDDVIVGGMATYAQRAPDPFVDPKRVLLMPWRGMIYRTLDGGRSWVDLTPHCTRLATEILRFDSGLPVYPCTAMNPTRVTHPDIHSIVRAPGGAVYVASDGGIYRGSIPSGPPNGKRRAVTGYPPNALAGLTFAWENLNRNLSTMQFYRVASHPTDPNILLGGLQDNTTAYWDGKEWQGWGCCDGTVAFFDPIDPRHVYLGSQFEVHRHDGGGAKEFTEAAGWKLSVFAGEEFTGDGELTAFIPVFALDPKEPSVTYGASDRALYRSTERGARSVRIGPATNTDGAPTTISVSPVDRRVVWTATDRGAVYRYDVAFDGTAISTRVDGTLPDRWASRIVAGFDSANTVYAVFNGYDASTPARPGKVFLSTDRGATWQNITGDLPDVPVSSIALDPSDANRLWIATDTAIYSTRNRGMTWQSERRNMPVVAVIDLDYNPRTGYLVAATYGRGIWRMKVSEGTTPAAARD